VPPALLWAFVVFAALVIAPPLCMNNLHALAASNGQVISSDFSIFRFAAELIWRGDYGTLFVADRFMTAYAASLGLPPAFTPFTYPPNGVWFVAPLAAVPAPVGLPLWLGATFLLLLLLLKRGLSRAGRTFSGAATAALLLAPASLVTLSFGQNGFLAAALLCGGLLALDGAPILAGVLFGLLSFKPQLGLLLPFILLAGGRLGTFLAAAATTLLLLLGSLAVFGREAWTDYFASSSGVQRAFLETAEGLGVFTMPSPFVAARLIGLPMAACYAFQAAATVVVIAACAWIFRRRDVPLLRKVPAVLIGAFLATPYCSSSDLCIVTVAQLILLGRHAGEGEPGSRRSGPVSGITVFERLLHGVVWLLPLLMAALLPLHLPIGALALAALFVVTLRAAARDRTGRPAGSASSAP
jgi:hypothetical protein